MLFRTTYLESTIQCSYAHITKKLIMNIEHLDILNRITLSIIQDKGEPDLTRLVYESPSEPLPAPADKYSMQICEVKTKVSPVKNLNEEPLRKLRNIRSLSTADIKLSRKVSFTLDHAKSVRSRRSSVYSFKSKTKNSKKSKAAPIPQPQPLPKEAKDPSEESFTKERVKLSKRIKGREIKNMLEKEKTK